MLIAEVKRNPERIDLKRLEKKAEKLLQKHQGYEVVFRGFSMGDMRRELVG